MVDGIPSRHNPRRPRRLWEGVRCVSPCPGGLVQCITVIGTFEEIWSQQAGRNRCRSRVMSCCLAPYRRSMVTSPWGFVVAPLLHFLHLGEADELAGLGMGLKLQQGLEEPIL